MKTYTQAPLPFQGQKRRFLKDFKEALNEFPADATYIDLFGGSGLLSHTVKSYYPKAKAIYNDYDGYSYRLENADKTNILLSDIRQLCPPSGNKTERLSDDVKSAIINRIEEEKGFVDYVTLSSSLLFSMNYATNLEQLKKEKFYSKVRQSNYVTTGYLEGVDIVKYDYKELFQEYKDQDNVVFLVDPPYLSTDVSTYNNKDYWRLTDYLDVLEVLVNTSYFYFTSNKSSLIELFSWLELHYGANNPFIGATKKVQDVGLTYNAKYQDIMLYKFNGKNTNLTTI
ncbi:DNA methyltransferase [Elizabethkingia miricola]|uniref:Site-specific DNA-adenine methylase n=1 Tax=Elizabethkingia miricola TaxID=172045 RepID=A0ABY3NAW2_ELIMR|nr:DNA methyltransferase [Elizabethkingia miricola]OBS12706.1 DNA methyltransferase [Elizabethkingia miricola]TYO84725.1 site-specific DNA-adenine methylase [Elizabethkingia miricola]